MLLTFLAYLLVAVVAFCVIIKLLAIRAVHRFKRVKNFGQGKSLYLKSPGIIFMIRQVLGLEKKDRGTVGKEVFFKYGMENKMYHSFMGPISTIYICSGDLAKTVLFDTKTFARRLIVPGTLIHYLSANSFANGTEEYWRPRRNIMNPSFARLDNYFPMFTNTIDECLDIWDRKLGKGNETVVENLPDRMARMALDVLGKYYSDIMT
jgi:cytochrome P450